LHSFSIPSTNEEFQNIPNKVLLSKTFT
jgi:hypothetical protein